MGNDLLALGSIHNEVRDIGWTNIYVDIDVRYEYFTESRTYRYMMRNLYRLSMQWDIVKRAWMRRSAGGNTHIRVDTTLPVGFVNMMMIRALLHDDVFRLAIDLRRLAYQGTQEVNRIFMAKIKDGAIATVGEWIPLIIHYVPDEELG